jgi:geranylgeranyl diphosphate synthase type I
MLNYLSTCKNNITTFCKQYFESLSSDYSRINRWGKDTLDRLFEYVSQGKMIRGGLISFSHSMFGGTRDESALRLGAAMELFQTAFLIHDDIMDRDLYRRGKPSMHAQYRTLIQSGASPLATEKIQEAAEGMGICVGDIAIFLAFEILGGTQVPSSILGSLLRLFTRELEYVGLAQMEDMYYSVARESPNDEKILALYRYKTGRYTFSLPLMAGAILAESTPQNIEEMSKLGENLGILFQIKDDELGIFADVEEFGKPIGSDILSDKKTLFRCWLLQKTEGTVHARLQSLFGASSITPDDLSFLRTVIRESGVLAEIYQLMDRLDGESRKCIDRLAVSPTWKEKLYELVEYNRSRSK